MERKMLIVLPVSPHDCAQGLELLKLWADMEPSFNESIGVAICVRFDMTIEKFIPKDIIRYVEAKFRVFTRVSRRKKLGWPDGCNGLELDAYEWFVEKNRSGGFDYPYMLIAESDTVPTRIGWANEIMNEAFDNNAIISGSMLFVPDSGCDHINGNCVISRDMWKHCRKIFHCPPRIGWDAYVGPFANSKGFASRLIWQDYRLGAPENPWKGDEHLFSTRYYKSERSPLFGQPINPAMIHGVKVLDAIAAVRKRCLS